MVAGLRVATSNASSAPPECKSLGGAKRTRIIIVGSIIYNKTIWTVICLVNCERREVSTTGRVRFLWAKNGSRDIVGPRLRGSSRRVHDANSGRRRRNGEEEGGGKEQDAN